MEMKAVAVNPVDVELLANTIPKEGYRVLGFDAARRVKAVGDGVTLFKEDDEVFMLARLIVMVLTRNFIWSMNVS
ncbi:alcohol dehydrogenase catalytic domain-containing protein [Bartonella sp. HY761]|uniref:alcohol dehydrogenase catalytic domain-containing protein n=1 Tax=Bartonella sp. HY761 TaxID=2979330 RepID=UPI0022082E88|nr:hypothetical protein [Bartonella sp. HY761]UXN05686.1 hypothetical protein N6A79_10330 [Bartonella sp. HY761]